MSETKTKNEWFEMPTKKTAMQDGQLMVAAIAGGALSKVLPDNVFKQDNLLVNGSLTVLGVGTAMAGKQPLVKGLGLGLGVFAFFRSLKNIANSSPLKGEGMEGIQDTLRMLNPLEGGLGNADPDGVVFLGNVVDEEMMGEDDVVMLGNATVYETIEGDDGEVIQLLGYTDGLGRTKKQWVKRLANAAGRAGNIGKQIAAQAIQNKTGLPVANMNRRGLAPAQMQECIAGL